MAKKYASDFIKMIEDEKMKYSRADYLDMLKELAEELEIRIQAEEDYELAMDRLGDIM